MERVSITVSGETLIVVVSGETVDSPTVGPVKTTFEGLNDTLSILLAKQRELQKEQQTKKAEEAKVEKKTRAKTKAETPDTSSVDAKTALPQSEKKDPVQATLFSDIE